MFHLLLIIIYLAFISLGLPDSLLGSAWPAMYQEFSVPVSYAGTCFMPPVFGFIANHISISLFPAYLLAILVLMAFMHEKMLSKVPVNKRDICYDI